MKNFLKNLYKKQNTPFVFLQISTYLFFIPTILLAYFFPQFFYSWMSNVSFFAQASLIFLVFNTFIVLLSIFNKRTATFSYTGSLWMLWYFIFILLTGGIFSTFTFAIIFVPIISVSFLDLKLARNLCILSVALLASVIFFEDYSTLSAPTIILHSVHVLGYSMLVLVVYKFVKEILYRKYQEEEAKRKFVELTEIDNVKRIFLTAMSHQLRTPLTATKWALDMMISNNNKIDPHLLRTGYDRVNQSIAIISDILKTAEFDVNPNALKVKKAKVYLDRVIENTVFDLKYLSENKKTSLIYKNFNQVSVMGDEKMLQLAISSVIDNAIRYSPAGQIEINLFSQNNKANLVVKDNGVGIDSADLEYIFQKFFRGKNAMLIDPNESGIGLYATKKIIELHGGNIAIASVLNKGTTITITLPVN